jgi:two-component system sensor histidine kinase MprB
MTFRRRLALSCAAAVAVAVILGSVLAYLIVRGTLRSQIDATLTKQVAQMEAGPPSVQQDSLAGSAAAGPDDGAMLLSGAPQVFTQIVSKGEAGVLTAQLGDGREMTEVANGTRGPFFADRRFNGVHVRVYTASVRPGNIVQAARPLTEVDDALGKLRWALAALTLAGVGLAVFLSRLATRTAVRPVAHLTATAEHVATTRDLSQRIDANGNDEVSRLARAFNTMLEALQRSQGAQRQLVADASHELRTPLTSLRTNMEVMARGGPPDAADRDRLGRDVVNQLEELTELVGDLVELARDGEPSGDPPEPLRLDELVAAAVERAARHGPHVTFASELEPCVVTGERGRLDRAVANLLDNAAKWSPPDAIVEVRLRDGELAVRDHGPGIAPEDLPHVFDRFYRSAAARGHAGSGLGLAIVRHVAEGHDGQVSAEAAPGGGALLRLALPVSHPIPI